MRSLKILNRINEAALFLYIPFVLLDFENMFYNDDVNGYITLICLVMFFTTFICGGAILVAANKKNIEDHSFWLSELKNINKAELVIILAAYITGMIIFIKNLHSDFLLFYIAVSTISLVFVLGEKIILPKAELSPYYKINIPLYFYPVPFILFIPTEIYFFNRVSEEHEDIVGLSIFAVFGIMLAFLAWHGYFVVDEKNGTIIKNHGILEFFNKGERAIVFDNITHAENHRLYYIVGDETKELKISKLYGNSKRLKRMLEEKGIYFSE